jgi:hypothetical protein
MCENVHQEPFFSGSNKDYILQLTIYTFYNNLFIDSLADAFSFSVTLTEYG